MENATDAAETEELPLKTVEISAEKTNETPKDNMNELKDTIETPTENVVEEVVNIVEIETIEETPMLDSIGETVAEIAVVAEKKSDVIEDAVIEADTLVEDIENIVEVPGEVIEVEDATVAAQKEEALTDVEASPEAEIPQLALEPIEEVHVQEEVDYSSFTKKDFVDLGEKLLASIKAEGVSISDVKNADVVMREIKPIFDDLKTREKSEALKK